MGILVLAGGTALVAAADGRALTQPDQPGAATANAGFVAAEQLLGHRFARPALLAEAMTHRSAARRQPGLRRGTGSNERLEFIGDRVLGLVIAEWLIERFPHEQEGELGRRLAQLVSQPALARIADHTRLTEMLSIAPAEERAGVRQRATVVADAIEAAIGALYLDGGLDAARRFIRASWDPALDAQSAPPKDAKTELQEWAQARGHELPCYSVASRTGPSHAPVFNVAVSILAAGRPIGEATGAAGSKREAEQLAAIDLLARLKGRTA